MTPMCPLFRGLTVLHSLLTHTHTHTHSQQAAAEGSGDEEEMEGIDTGESIMSHISVPSQQEVYIQLRDHLLTIIYTTCGLILHLCGERG